MKNAKPATMAARLAELLTSLHGDVFLEVLLAMLKHNIHVTNRLNSAKQILRTKPIINIARQYTLNIILQNNSLILQNHTIKVSFRLILKENTVY